MCDTKPATEQHLYAQLITLLGLELRWCCYDLTSTYFETTNSDADPGVSLTVA